MDADDMELKVIMASDGQIDGKDFIVSDNFKKYYQDGNVVVMIASNDQDCKGAIQNILKKHKVLPQNFVGLVNVFSDAMEPTRCASFIIGVLDSIRPYVIAMHSMLKMDHTTSDIVGGAGLGCDHALMALEYRSSRAVKKYVVRKQQFDSDPTNPMEEIPIVSASQALKWVHEAMVYAAHLDNNKMGGSFYDVFCGELVDGRASWEHQRFDFEEMKCSFPECYFDYLASDGA